MTAGHNPAAFYDRLAETLAQCEGRLYGFSSICSSYYITLAVVRELKKRKPEAVILLGGPQASLASRETMTAFPSVSCIIHGEAERAIPAFLCHYESAPEKVPGLVWRTPGGEVSVNDGLRPESLDDLPLPAYDLCQGFAADTLVVEAGRGCPFTCRFCATSVFFGRRSRTKSPRRIIEEVAALRQLHPFKHLSLLHDTMFVTRPVMEEFCRAWVDDPRVADLTWSCSLRADTIPAGFIDSLARAGCRSVFIGVETGSQRMQEVIDKRLDLGEVTRAIGQMHQRKIATTVSLIVGFPEETVQETSLTLDFYGDMLRRRAASPQLDILSPIRGSCYYEQYRGALSYDGNVSSVAHQGVAISRISPEYDRLVRAHPELFSAHYSLPSATLPRRQLLQTMFFLRYAQARARWLLALLWCVLGDMSSLVQRFMAYAEQRRTGEFDCDFWTSLEFQKLFFAFCRSLLSSGAIPAGCKEQVEFMVSVYRIEEDEIAALSEAGKRHVDASLPTGCEMISAACLIRTGGFSFRDLVDAMDSGTPVANVGKSPSLVIVYKQGEAILIEEATRLTAALVRQVESPQTVQAIAQRLASTQPDLLPGAVRNPVAGFQFAINTLLEQGVLVAAGPAAGA